MDQTKKGPRQGRARTTAERRWMYPFYTTSEMRSLGGIEWLVEGVLPLRALGQLVGVRGTGKTFVALDLALRVAAGVDWFGDRRVRPGRVVYAAGEGVHGLTDRLDAWCEANDVVEDVLKERFRLVPKVIHLGSEESVDAFLNQVAKQFDGHPPALLVIDTQARATSGLEENAGVDPVWWTGKRLGFKRH